MFQSPNNSLFLHAIYTLSLDERLKAGGFNQAEQFGCNLGHV